MFYDIIIMIYIVYMLMKVLGLINVCKYALNKNHT